VVSKPTHNSGQVCEERQEKQFAYRTPPPGQAVPDRVTILGPLLTLAGANIVQRRLRCRIITTAGFVGQVAR